MSLEPRIEIVEQPAPSMVFRYTSEGRSSTLLGINSTAERITYPAINILNYTGKGSIVVSCVTEHAPYRSHPHQLVGNNCPRGVCYIPNFETNSESPSVISFPQLSIQSVKTNEIEGKLRERKVLRIDPFRQGFQHCQDVGICLDSVRLCFQVILRPDKMNPAHKIMLEPTVTQPIYNMRKKTELKITRLSVNSSPMCGGTTLMMFCNRIQSGDIKVRFFEMCEKNQIWEDWGTSLRVEAHTGLVCMTPKYQHQDVKTAVNVYVQLVRPSDNAQSRPTPFQYIPDFTNQGVTITKYNVTVSEGLCNYISETNNPNTSSTSGV